jgi:hypothetical protein
MLFRTSATFLLLPATTLLIRPDAALFLLNVARVADPELEDGMSWDEKSKQERSSTDDGGIS